MFTLVLRSPRRCRWASDRPSSRNPARQESEGGQPNGRVVWTRCSKIADSTTRKSLLLGTKLRPKCGRFLFGLLAADLGARLAALFRVRREMIDREWRDRIACALRRFASGRMQRYEFGRHALTDEQRRIVARWVLFLRSSEPYEWPVRGSDLLAVFHAIRPLGKSWRANEETWARAGERALWSFVSAGQLAHVASTHPFARSSASAT